MLVVSGGRKGIFSLSAPNETEVRLLVKPSRAVFAHLLSSTNVKRIYCSSGIYATIPKKVVQALSESGIGIEVAPAKRGRPERVGGGEFELASNLSGKIGVKDAIARAGSARSTYYWKRKKAHGAQQA